MPDFGHLLRKPVSDAKKPPALPVGDYPGRILRFEVDDKNKNKTPYVRLHLALTGPSATVDPSELEGIELSKKRLSRDLYLTEDADWRLAELIKSCGIASEGRTFEETVPELVNQDVMIEVQQYTTKENELANQVGKVRGMA